MAETLANDRIIPDCIRAAMKKKSQLLCVIHFLSDLISMLEPLMVYLQIGRSQYEDKRYEGYYNVGPDDGDCVTTGELATLFVKRGARG